MIHQAPFLLPTIGVLNSDLSVSQELEDVTTQGEGHHFSVQQTQTNHTPHVTEGIEPESGLGAGPGGVVARLAGLVEQGGFTVRA